MGIHRLHVRVRRDALVHDRAPVRDPLAGHATGGAPAVPRAVERPLSGRDLPRLAVLDGLGTAAAFVVTVVLHPEVAAAGFGWLALGIVIYLIFRQRHGLDLVSTF